MAKTGFKWEVTPEAAFTALYDDYTKRIYQAINALAKKYAAEIEAWLKAERKWTDRTGNLRQSLYAEVESKLTEIVIAFDYGLDYGKYLEFQRADVNIGDIAADTDRLLAFYLEFGEQGRYAIIAPALDYFAPKFWNDVQALFR